MSGQLGPGGRLVCPYCWQVFSVNDVTWATFDLAGNEQPGPPRPPGRLARWLARAVRQVRRLLGRGHRPDPKGIERRHRARCPFCQELLPESLHDSQAIVIGLVGGPSSGKTHYLTALIRELADGAALSPDGCIRFAADDETDRRYRTEYYAPLFDRRERLRLTERLREGMLNRPLVFEMAIRSRTATDTAAYTVLFFDASGEDLEDAESQRRYDKYLFYADGLIFFADPHAMPKAIRWIAPTMPPPAGPVPSGAAAAAPDGQEGDGSPAEPSPGPIDISPRPDDGDGTRRTHSRRRWRAAGEPWAPDVPAEGPEPDQAPDGDGDRFDKDNPAVAGPKGPRQWVRATRAGLDEDGTGIVGPGAAPADLGAFATSAAAPVGTRLPHQLIQDVVGRYQRAHGRPPHAPLDLPVAVVIPKADELKYVKPVAERISQILPSVPLDADDGAPRRQEPYTKMDLVLTSGAVKEVLDEIADPALLVACEQFHEVTYHAVSATGCSPDRTGHYPQITPQRVVDPFAWLLLRLPHPAIGVVP
jgi:hypothetical protein